MDQRVTTNQRKCICGHTMPDHGLPESDADLPTMANWCNVGECPCGSFRDTTKHKGRMHYCGGEIVGADDDWPGECNLCS